MKWVVLTGDSGGLGGAILKALLSREGVGVIGLSRSFEEQQRKAKDGHPDRYVHVTCDLSHPDSIPDLYRDEMKPVGPIYGCVNNAASAYDDLVTNAQVDDLERMFRINVLAPILLTKYCIRDMILHETHGSIVHISSVSVRQGYNGLSMYAATKGALEAFSRGVAHEWGARGIRSNCVAPGFIETTMSSGLSDDQKERIYARTALREPTSAESVAESVVFLLSDAARSITGSVIDVDAGR